MAAKLLSDKIQEFMDWLEANTDVGGWDQGTRIWIHKKLIEILLQPDEKQHEWEFYMNGSFCKKCGTQLGSGQPCR